MNRAFCLDFDVFEHQSEFGDNGKFTGGYLNRYESSSGEHEYSQQNPWKSGQHFSVYKVAIFVLKQ